LNPKTTYSEQELVALLQQRNEKAFGYLYDNYSGALFGIVNGIIPDKDTASDVLQNVFINIWRKIDLYNPSKGRLFTWMLNIARNAAIDELRSRGYRDTQKTIALPDNEDKAGPPVTETLTADVGLKKVLMKLKADLRVLIDLSYFQGFTHEEISKTLGIPLGTVKTRIRTALIQLRTMIN
jgi:RNA polymerase sigma-70 factor (ECF subfamily)